MKIISFFKEGCIFALKNLPGGPKSQLPSFNTCCSQQSGVRLVISLGLRGSENRDFIFKFITAVSLSALLFMTGTVIKLSNDNLFKINIHGIEKQMHKRLRSSVCRGDKWHIDVFAAWSQANTNVLLTVSDLKESQACPGNSSMYRWETKA